MKYSTKTNIEANDIGKTIFVVEAENQNVNDYEKYKFIEVNFEKIFLSSKFILNVNIENNASFKLNNNLVFYVPKGQAKNYFQIIQEEIKSAESEFKKGDKVEFPRILAQLGNQIIAKLLEYNQHLSFNMHPSSTESARKYVEERGKALKEKHTEDQVKDLESLGLESGESSLSDISEGKGEKQKFKVSYPDLIGMEENLNQLSIDAFSSNKVYLTYLKKWLGETKLVEQEQMGELSISIGTLEPELYFDKVKEKVNNIVTIVHHGFKNQIVTLKFHRSYKDEIEKIIYDYLKNTKIEKDLNGIKQLTDNITKNVPRLIKDFATSNKEYVGKEEEYSEWRSDINKFVKSLVTCTQSEIDELYEEMDAWWRKLDEYRPKIVDGHIQSQDPLSEEIKELKNRIDKHKTDLQAKNQEKIREMWGEETKETAPKMKEKIKKLDQERNNMATNKSKILFKICNSVSAIEKKIFSSVDLAEIEKDINKLKHTIDKNKDGISSYRSRWGSGFFFEKILRINLESRVTSKHLVDELNNHLDTFKSKITIQK